MTGPVRVLTTVRPGHAKSRAANTLIAHTLQERVSWPDSGVPVESDKADQ